MKRHLAWIEALRTVAIALVVLVHVDIFTKPEVNEWWPGGYWSVVLFSLAVPTFFLVSGFVLSLAHPDPAEPLPLGAFVRRKLSTLLIPFFVWNAAMLAVMTLLGATFTPCQI